MPRLLLDPVIIMVSEQQLAVDGIVVGTFRLQGPAWMSRGCILCTLPRSLPPWYVFIPATIHIREVWRCRVQRHTTMCSSS
jgi:hypothetical protein